MYDPDIDHIVGVIHQKDFYHDGRVTEQALSDLATPALFVHQTEKLDDLLQLLRSEKSHIAVVVDEAGGTLGIVTMEDILEELVGEIWDEHDVVREPIRPIGEQSWLVSGDTSLGDFEDFFDVETESESTVVGGWVTDVMDRLPRAGDSLRYENLSITVEAVADHRVQSVRVSALPGTEEER